MTPFRVGLTGSIGMGKSTTAALFAEKGVPVWDADAAVHRLYAPGGLAALAISAIFPEVMTSDGSVSRPRLRKLILTDPTVMDRLNAAVHPLVAADRQQFLLDCADSDIVLLDIPLLFETGADQDCDAVVVVSAPDHLQRSRVVARGMTERELRLILDRQMPDSEKRARATWVIETLSLDNVRQAVDHILTDIRDRPRNA